MFVYHSQRNSGGAEQRALQCCEWKVQCPFLQDKLTRQNRPGAERDLGDHLICPSSCQQGIPRPTGLDNLQTQIPNSGVEKRAQVYGS